MYKLQSVCISLLALIILPPTAKALKCFVCNNGNEALPACESGPPQVTDNVELVEYDPAVNNTCKTMHEFFTKHAFVNSEWSKRNPPVRRRTISIQSIGYYCVSIIMENSNERVSHVYRDCVKGNNDELEYGFKDFYRVPLNLNDAGRDHCRSEKFGTSHGTKRIHVCLCEKDACNNKSARNEVQSWLKTGLEFKVIIFISSVFTYATFK